MRSSGVRCQQGVVTTEYALLSVLLAVALGIGFTDGGPLDQLLDAFGLAWQRFVYAMSTAF